jgi:DNA (cytosine-5)-methyltransferase 1
MFAVHRSAEVIPTLPAATHRWVLPRGYEGTRAVALQSLNLFDKCRYLSPPAARSGQRGAVTARQALCDLPPITAHLRGEMKKAPRRFDEPIALSSKVPNDFVGAMRHWPAFSSDGFVYDHVIRYLPRDYRIFERMNPGDQYPEAHRHALNMRDEAVAQLERERGEPIAKTSREYKALTRALVPPYDPGKFPNKWRKMEADAPARTLMAHIGKDTYSHIHYDSDQARTISVREGARLQSFPDGFRFSGTMNPAFRQIGNAVPPLLANAVFRHLIQLVAAPSYGQVREKKVG